MKDFSSPAAAIVPGIHDISAEAMQKSADRREELQTALDAALARDGAFGDLSLGGHVWQGLGDLIGISPISTTYQVSAEQVTFDLAATPELMALALGSKARFRGRSVTIYLQLYTMEPEAAIGSPIALYSGTMQRMPWSASGPGERRLRLECEGNFFRRNAAPRGRWTDSDQKARYPGDRGLERLPVYANGYETRWRG